MGGYSLYQHLHEGGKLLESRSAYHRQDVIPSTVTCEGCPAATLLLWAIAPGLVDPWASRLFQRFHLDIAVDFSSKGVHNDIFFMLAMQHHVLGSYNMLILLMRLTTLKLTILPFMKTLKFILTSRRVSHKTINHCAIHDIHDRHFTRKGKFDLEGDLLTAVGVVSTRSRSSSAWTQASWVKSIR